MSHIFTAEGWKALTPLASCPPIAEAPPLYRGPLPSFECQAYIAKLDRDHKEWVTRRKQLQGGS